MPFIADSAAAPSGPTLGQLVTEIVTTAQGYAVAPDQMVTLKSACDDTALSLIIEGAASPGEFEIGDELIYVTAVDATSGTCTVHPRGRGWKGTTAAAHDVGDVVTVSPALPRGRCASMVNDTISSLFPLVFGVASGQTVVDGTMVSLPADAVAVLDVRALSPDGDWDRVRYWEAENASAVGTTKNAVRLPRTELGATVQVVYATRPAPLTSSTQQWSETGLEASLKRVVVLGVLADFARLLDIGRLTDRFDTPHGDAQQPQLGSGLAMARQLGADFQQALDREVKALRDRYPARAHFVR